CECERRANETLPGGDLSRARRSRGARRARGSGSLGCRADDARGHAGPVRAVDPPSRRRDLLLRLRGPVGELGRARGRPRSARAASRGRGDLVRSGARGRTHFGDPDRRGGRMKRSLVLPVSVAAVVVLAPGSAAARVAAPRVAVEPAIIRLGQRASIAVSGLHVRSVQARMDGATYQDGKLLPWRSLRVSGG